MIVAESTGCVYSDALYIAVLDKVQEYVSYLRIELRTLVLLDLFYDSFPRQLLTVDSVGIHRIERIRHADHTRDEGDRLAFLAFRVTLAIVSLVMVSGTFRNVRKALEAA